MIFFYLLGYSNRYKNSDEQTSYSRSLPLLKMTQIFRRVAFPSVRIDLPIVKKYRRPGKSLLLAMLKIIQCLEPPLIALLFPSG